MAKGYKTVITHFLVLPAKYNYSALASPRPRIVFFLQPSVVGYNYYLYMGVSESSVNNACMLLNIVSKYSREVLFNIELEHTLKSKLPR